MRALAVPVKPMQRSKTRLTPALTPAERATLTLAMLEDVLDACLEQSGWETWVISGSSEALAVAGRLGARALPEHGSSLLQAVRQAEGELPEDSDELAIVLADLPLLTAGALSEALSLPGAVIAAPAESDEGTNLLVRRPPTAITARFGRHSYRRHRAGAYRQGLTFREARSAELGFDLDRPDDLLTLLAMDVANRTTSACRSMGLPDRLRVGA